MNYVRDAKGSVSAEHGLGFQKAEFISYSKSPEMIKAMRLIKNAFDPNGIMNPYKVLPPEHWHSNLFNNHSLKLLSSGYLL